ncbi:MarR family winged helix-turn-helix transcriptional regulator [Jannaschia seohaensis]|uniref:DNA-binding MarR family transcriptional regulator n=1 Tax=Jannaschia seohaensis TaxID=475081 RepID=A0A2Y9BVX4_9RHOB|nr:MarR family transcriptional regulator [Jannaschia seohaensis]PWJ21814.1 DNA-binding MarR family transcriptional regulator [Jannaschia seohaensis]SSA38092.1 DNA-binding transcriptional regulator, MarR family [Jannaschia seohaensis]
MTDLPAFDLEGYLPYRFTVIAAELSDGLARQYRDRFGISIAEWRVLVNVGYGESPALRDIERRVRLEKSKVSRAASRLEAKGYLRKEVDAHDRRLLRLTLTEAGAALLARLIPIAEAYQAELVGRLGPEATLLHAALDRLSPRG